MATTMAPRRALPATSWSSRTIVAEQLSPRTGSLPIVTSERSSGAALPAASWPALPGRQTLATRRASAACRLARLSTRLRLTVAFAAVMALVLTGTGLFLYLRFESELDRTIDQSLRTQATDVTALIKQADSGLAQSARGPLTRRGESLAQVLDPHGHIVDATPEAHEHALLDRALLGRALKASVLVDRGPGEALDERSRLLATPVSAQDRRLVVVVGSSLSDRNRALRNLATLLGIGGPVALVLASLAGYGVAAAALRPVESMRRRAAAISASEPGQRLPVPASRDEIGRLGSTLNEMLARLEASFARERTFVADASHELRTPLAILKTELELALRSPRSRAQLQAALRSAAQESDRLSQLAEDLLVIARMDEGQLPVRPAALHASELLERVRDRYARRARGDGRELHVMAEDLPFVADPLRVEQALGNMVDNALRYGEGEVTLRAAASDGAVELHVQDQGPGFASAYLPAAFERFSRPEQGRAGAGLGLAIVAAVAKAHDGSAHATNRPHRGADVWIRLPASSPDAD